MRQAFMKKRHYILALLFSIAFNCSADETGLQSGVWLGSIKLPGKDKVSARIQVRKITGNDAEQKTKVTMYVDDTPLDFIDLKIRKQTLHFNIDTGTIKQCSMTKQDNGAYAGFCSASDEQDRIELSMRPPKASDENSEKPADTETNP